ncbi:3-(3-hydroxy-phenyl)propionate/3-hydroxycinnamic acid hydroxylase [Streptomyces sp. YIM 121038]|uniref:FAD-dependent monooxygenase n=1 Tax=Streptomyces sp. YIM 121038 TaxID=2136401 RepID=UPI0011107F62|nr:FAD-dependent monooxygenase [Streptomyces sp. YIM 121038]QCX79536.1 3-(3-hydroxy-phenyl)propionate/3-hydroxycinnamic acid hydroxylase [Streptomyces sp. YIM 121038]
MDPVIVVGAGPVGLTLALALARHSVPTVVLDEGPGKDEQRPARTVVLREDTAALVERLCGVSFGGPDTGARWGGWRSMRRKQVMRQLTFSDEMPSPLHVPQHVLTGALRDAIVDERLVKVAVESKLDTLEQDASGLTAHTRGPKDTWWRGSYLVGCDGPRSTVRKLLDIRFPGRTAVERHAVAALRTELPWPGEALLHRSPPWPGGGPEVTARPLPGGVWRVDWLLPPRGDLVTPDALVSRVRETLSGWCGATPPYDLLDTGVHTVHHRLARRWRSGRCFLAGDAAHLLGAVGTQGLDEGLRDADNLAWKLALAWHHGASGALLDSYQTERRAAVAARLRAADQSLPVLRGGGGLRSYVPGAARGQDALLTDGHVGRGQLGAPGAYADSPLSPGSSDSTVLVATESGAPVIDVAVTAPDGSVVRLRDRFGLSQFLVVLVAPGTVVWDRRHWMKAGIMPRLAAAVTALPAPAELLVAESYPGAAAHTVLLVRPDGRLVTALNGVRPAELYAAAEAALGKAVRETPEKGRAKGAPKEDGGPKDAGAAPGKPGSEPDDARAADRTAHETPGSDAKGGRAAGGKPATGPSNEPKKPSP